MANGKTQGPAGPIGTESASVVAERALQQILATAVKHAAEEAFVEIAGDRMVALFRFEDQSPVTVEVACSPEGFAGAVLRHFQPTGKDGSALVGMGRLEFKSFTVDFEARIRSGQEPASRAAVGLVSSAARRSVSLSRFLVDSPQNPLFWLGVDHCARPLREILSDDDGVILVVSPSHAARNFGLRSIRDAYPNAEIIPLLEGRLDSSRAVERAERRTVAVGINDKSDLHILPLLADLARDAKRTVRAVLALQIVARNCPFCVHDSLPKREHVEMYQRVMSKSLGRTLRGSGCAICEHQGISGKALVSSFLDLRGEVGEAIRASSDPEKYFGVIAESPYQSLFDSGAAQAAHGFITVETLATSFASPPALYLERKQRSAPNRKPSRGDAPITIADDFFFVPGEERTDETAMVVVPPEVAAAQAAIEAITDPPMNSLRMLIVSSQPEHRSHLASFFELHGLSVETAADAVDGVLAALQRPPAVVVFDCDGTDTDLIAAIKQLKSHEMTKSAPILALLQVTNSPLEEALFDAGADDVCARDSSPRVIQKRLDRLVQRDG